MAVLMNYLSVSDSFESFLRGEGAGGLLEMPPLQERPLHQELLSTATLQGCKSMARHVYHTPAPPEAGNRHFHECESFQYINKSSNLLLTSSKHSWSNGRIIAFQAIGSGSTPGGCN
jgi:hypothetical protein